MANTLASNLQKTFGKLIKDVIVQHEQVTVVVDQTNLKELCLGLRDDPQFQFDQLTDVCGVDYLHYGMAEWKTEKTTAKESLHLLSTLFLSTWKRRLTRDGKTRTVTARARTVPMVAEPKRLCRIIRWGTSVPSSSTMKGTSRSGNMQPTISPGRLSRLSSL